MKKYLIIKFSALVSFLTLAPAIAGAQRVGNTTQVDFWVAKLFEYARMAISFLIILATLFFIWNVIQYIRYGNTDATKKSEYQKKMLTGLIGLAVIVCMWGIVYFLSNTFGIQGGAGGPVVPCPPGTRPVGPAGNCI